MVGLLPALWRRVWFHTRGHSPLLGQCVSLTLVPAGRPLLSSMVTAQMKSVNVADEFLLWLRHLGLVAHAPAFIEWDVEHGAAPLSLVPADR